MRANERAKVLNIYFLKIKFRSKNQAFYEILEGRISPAQDPLDDILPNFGEEDTRIANDITDAVLYDRAGGYEVLSIVMYLTTKTNLDLNTVKLLYF